MSLQRRPSATSLMVKSNSLRATKSTAGAASRLFSGSTATLAPMKPILMSGLAVLIFAAVELGGDVLEAQAVRRRIDQLRALDESGRLREPGRIPEGAYLALHLVA